MEWDYLNQRWIEKDAEGRAFPVAGPSSSPTGSLNFGSDWQNFGSYFKTPDGKFVIPQTENWLQPNDPLSGAQGIQTWVDGNREKGSVATFQNPGTLMNISGLPSHSQLGGQWGQGMVSDTAPTVSNYQAPKDGFMGSDLQGLAIPGMWLAAGGLAGLMGSGGAAAGGAGGAMDMGIGGIGEAMGLGGPTGTGGGMWEWVNSLFNGGSNPAQVLWDQAPGGLGQAVTGGGGNAVFDLSNLGAASGTIPGTTWPASNLWSGGLGVSDVVNGVKTGAGLLNGNSSLLGAGLGALLGGSQAGNKPAGYTTTIQDIPDWLKPFVMNNLAGATSKAGQIGTGTPLLGPAEQQLMSTMRGDYLTPDSNPYLKATVDDALGQAASRFNSQYNNVNSGGDNMFNSGYQEALSRNLANTALPYYNQNYQTERGRQLGAATSAPDFTTSQYQAAFSPFTSYGNLTRGLGVGTTSSPYFSNPTSGALGGALLGSQFGKIFSGGGPFG